MSGAGRATRGRRGPPSRGKRCGGTYPTPTDRRSVKCRARGEPREGGAVLPLVKTMWRNKPAPTDSAGTDARPIFGAMKLRKCEPKQGFPVLASLTCTKEGASEVL